MKEISILLHRQDEPNDSHPPVGNEYMELRFRQTPDKLELDSFRRRMDHKVYGRYRYQLTVRAVTSPDGLSVSIKDVEWYCGEYIYNLFAQEENGSWKSVEKPRIKCRPFSSISGICRPWVVITTREDEELTFFGPLLNVMLAKDQENSGMRVNMNMSR